MRRTHQALRSYQPDRGDFVYVDFTPNAGTEQAGRRPGLVLSPQKYNIASGLCIVCPITNQVKGNAFEVAVPPGSGVTGVILADHVKSIDWIARKVELRGKASEPLIIEVLSRIAPLFFPD